MANDDFLKKFNKYIRKAMSKNDNQDSDINLEGSPTKPTERFLTKIKNQINIYRKKSVIKAESDS